jgi:hypothetical protein
MDAKKEMAVSKMAKLENYFQGWQGEPIRRGRARQNKITFFFLFSL